MLKSVFNLAQGEEVQEEQQAPIEEEEREPEILADEEHIVRPPARSLNRSEVSVRLSLLGKTAEGDGYTYLKATLTNMGLEDISAIKSFKYLQFLDVSNNNLTLNALQPVTELPSLVLIQADQNRLQSAALNKMKYLQVMILNKNFLTTVHDIFQPELSTLEAADNKIRRLFFLNRMHTMRCLDFRNNLIDEISELDFPNLDSLYLASNKIKSLVGIEKLVNLRILHVRNNPIRLLDGFGEGLKKLQYINLRNCKVSTLIQVKKLRVLPSLETLVMKGCPYMGGTGEENADAGGGEEDDNELRVEMLAALPRLKRINKTVVTPEERTEAKDLMMTWLEEGEKDEEELVEEHGEEEIHNEEE